MTVTITKKALASTLAFSLSVALGFAWLGHSAGIVATAQTKPQFVPVPPSATCTPGGGEMGVPAGWSFKGVALGITNPNQRQEGNAFIFDNGKEVFIVDQVTCHTLFRIYKK